MEERREERFGWPGAGRFRALSVDHEHHYGVPSTHVVKQQLDHRFAASPITTHSSLPHSVASLTREPSPVSQRTEDGKRT